MNNISEHRSRADRFIPQRSNQDLNLSNYYLQKVPYSFNSADLRTKSNSKYMNSACSIWRRLIYEEKLWSAIHPKSKKILNFCDYTSKRPIYSLKKYHWPVLPRKQPLINSPLMILDMPEFDSSILHNVVDWGSKGFIACIFEQEIYLWKPEMKLSYVITNTNRKVCKALKWNKTSELFAFAMEDQQIGIWNCTTNKVVYQTHCRCIVSGDCCVTSFCWSSKNWLISGCSKGRLCMWDDASILRITCVRAHTATIITIALSCAETYLATSSADGIVRVWHWPTLRENFQINYNSAVRNIAWHPWENPLLMTAECEGEGILSLWKAGNQQLVEVSPCQGFVLDAFTWNPLTAELVISVWQKSEDDAGDGTSTIMVMSDMSTILDAIEWHRGRVTYLLWGNDGTRLGTIGSDENLCIWEFFGTSDMKKKLKQKKNEAGQKLSAQPLKNLFKFGATIR